MWVRFTTHASHLPRIPDFRRRQDHAWTLEVTTGTSRAITRCAKGNGTCDDRGSRHWRCDVASGNTPGLVGENLTRHLGQPVTRRSCATEATYDAGRTTGIAGTYACTEQSARVATKGVVTTGNRRPRLPRALRGIVIGCSATALRGLGPPPALSTVSRVEGSRKANGCKGIAFC